MKNYHIFYLIAIVVLGGFLRLYGINWDQGHHLHPDERAIVMFTLPLHWPSSIQEFFSPTSPLNPHFFAYGNFPLYLLKGIAVALSIFDKSFDSYDKINLIGRATSAIADLGTIILIYFIGKKIFNKTVGIIATFFYSLSVFPIQASHFYAVDTLLTFFIILTLYQLLRFYEKPSIKNSMLSGVLFGFALATKVSAIPLIIVIALTIALDFMLLVVKQPHKPHIWLPHLPRFLKRLLFDGITIAISTIVAFSILQPYAIIDLQAFLRQTQEQSRMTSDAFTFPYTLQYVGKIPYLYELKNIFLWGQGPILATLSFLGTIYISFSLIRKHLGWWRKHQTFDSSEVNVHLRGVHPRFAKASPGESATSKVFDARPKTIKQFNNATIIILIFFFIYFLIVGKFAVGWMRYMLPLYPLLCLFGAISFLHILSFLPTNFRKLFAICYLLFAILWPLSFIHIYTKPNTRVLASQWIYHNIPPDKKIALEHWDDGMPIGGNIAYKTLDLPIYEMQNPLRETQVYQTLQEADYIIIASNRLYVPLQRISKNCQKWNLLQERCSHNANRYYEKLFSGELGYKEVAEFSSYPKYPKLGFPLVKWEHEINDSSADESFTVYDHPKVMIFENKQDNL